MIEIIRNAKGKVFFKTTIDVVKVEHQDLGMGKTPTESVSFVFDPETVGNYRPSNFKGEDEFIHTHVDFKGLDSCTVNCSTEELEALLMFGQYDEFEFWIPLTKSVPENGDKVHISNGEHYGVAYREYDEWRFESGVFFTPTHYAPIKECPKPPREIVDNDDLPF